MTPIKNNPEFINVDLHRQARALRAQAIGEALGIAARAVAEWFKRRVAGPIAARVDERRQFDELMAMDDHMLRDLGLARGNIAYAFENGRDHEVPVPANVNIPANKVA